MIFYKCKNTECNWKLGCNFSNGKLLLSRTCTPAHTAGCPYSNSRKEIPPFIRRETARLALSVNNLESKSTKLLSSVITRDLHANIDINVQKMYNTTYYYKKLYGLTFKQQELHFDNYLDTLTHNGYVIEKINGRTLILMPYAKKTYRNI